ncbi:MAG: hypothetical protein AAGA29_03905 [Planctomycetota bacterium]
MNRRRANTPLMGRVLSLVVAGLAVGLMLIGPDWQPTAEARNGSTSASPRTASPSTTRRPRSGAIRTTRSTPSKPTSAAAANVRAQVGRATSPRAGQRTDATRRASVTRPRSTRGSISGSSARAAARRNSVSDLTSGYRPADPAPLRTGSPIPGASPRPGSTDLSATVAAQGRQIADLTNQVNQLRQSLRLIQTDTYRNSIMSTTAFNGTIVNEARMSGRL